MYKSPYETAVLKPYTKSLSDIKSSVETSILAGNGQVIEHSDYRDIHFVVSGETPVFRHPIIVRDRNSNNTVVVDLRAYGRIDASGRITGNWDNNFYIRRAQILKKIWLDENNRDATLSYNDLPIKAFAHMVSLNITRRKNLTLNTEVKIKVIAAFYYICLHYRDMFISNSEAAFNLAKKISRVTTVPIDLVVDILDKVGFIENIYDLAKALRDHTDEIKLAKLEAKELILLTGGIWFGHNAAENVAVALEHPATFLAMLSLLTEQIYRKSTLHELVKQVDRKGTDLISLERNIRHMIGN